MNSNYQVLKGFENLAFPNGLVQGSDGAFYGTTFEGGALSEGSVFKMSADGSSFSVLHSFYGLNGSHPNPGLVEGSDGSFYGTTNNGGAAGIGTVFKLSADGSSFSVLHSFDATSSYPYAGLVQGLDGDFYGTTAYGGPGYGTVFKLSADGSSFSVLHSFADPDGRHPYARLVQGSDGAFYGTTTYGGAAGYGTAFKLSADGSSFSLLHSFDLTGAYTQAGLVQGMDGALYGTTVGSAALGGEANGYGTVFRLTADGSAFFVIHTFDLANGAYPYAELALGTDGALYGTTVFLGASNNGALFRVSEDGSSFSVIHSFDGLHGSLPDTGLVQGTDGAFYGTTQFGGAFDAGTAFRVLGDGSSFAVIHGFERNGFDLQADLVQGLDGALYGTALRGGASAYGTVFKASPDGSSFSVIHDFGFGQDGVYPYAGLVQGLDGVFYGTTSGGGTLVQGSVFKITADGSSYSVIHSFDGPNGIGPDAGLVQGTDGAFYGTTRSATGPSAYGSVFKVFPDGSSFSVLHIFDYTNGSGPYAELVQGTDGAFYGTTAGGGASYLGTVFRISANGASFSVIHSFDGPNGANPNTNLIRGTDGAFYGTTGGGGASDAGTVFKITADGSNFSVIHSFDGLNGANPYAGLVLGRDGAFYGTTGYGGALGVGTVFKVSADGSSFAVHDCDPLTGSHPFAGLVQGTDGALYGTMNEGGPEGAGVVFRLLSIGPAAADQAVSTTENASLAITLTATDPDNDISAYAIVAPPKHGALSGAEPDLIYTPNFGFTGSDSFTFKASNSRGWDSSVATVSITVTKGIRFSRPVFTASQPGTMAVLSVTRTEHTSSPATVDYATSDGTATAGVDYVANTGQLSFAPGVVTKVLSVPLLPNTTYDGDESFLVALSNPQGAGAALGFQRTAVVVLRDRNPVPRIEFSAATYAAIEGSPAAKITVLRSGVISAPVTVSFATVDGTAAAPGDYATSTGSLSFGPGAVSHTFLVPITDDQSAEPRESLGLVLSNPGGGAVLGVRSTATVAIKDNDQAVQFGTVSYSVGEASPRAIITVRRTGGGSGTITVDYATGTGTATAGNDYQTTSGTLTFGPGVVTKTFAVPIQNDVLDEGSETVPLTLSNANPAPALGSLSAATLTILDNEPVVQFSAAKYTGVEPMGTLSGKVVITVKRLNGSTGIVHVNYATSAGTAVPGLDYTDTSGQLTFGPGVIAQTFVVALLGNTVDAVKPTVNLTLTAVDIPLGTPNESVLTLTDNDVAGVAQLAAAGFSGVADAGEVTITVKRSGGVAGPASVAYATTDGTAVAGIDYTAATGTLTFGPGETTKALTIAVTGVSLPDKYFVVALGATTGNLGLGAMTRSPVWIVE